MLYKIRDKERTIGKQIIEIGRDARTVAAEIGLVERQSLSSSPRSTDAKRVDRLRYRRIPAGPNELRLHLRVDR